MRTTASTLVFLWLIGLFTVGCGRAQPTVAVAVNEGAPPDATTVNPHPPRIRLNEPIPGDPRASFDVVNLDDENLAKLSGSDWKQNEWTALFAVWVDQGKGVDRANQPPVSGSYRVEEGAVRFIPQFPLRPGLRYRAYFDPARLPVRGDLEAIEKEFPIPEVEVAGGTVIEEVYPTRNALPENQLKFYIHFSAPMSRGDAYKHIRLIKIEMKDKKRIETQIQSPFFELREEAWDPSGRRFTLFMDPGRIKRGLKPREELGPALEEGKEYALAIARDWRDADGKPLLEAYRKNFRVLPPDEKLPDTSKWEITAPPAATVEPLTIRFPKPMDHALLQRCIWVVDTRGRKRPGAVTVKFQEIHFEFAPEDPWEVGKYQLVVDTDLEDLSGNNLTRPFEVDIFKKVDSKVKTQAIAIPFEVPIPGKDVPEKAKRAPEKK